MREDLNIILVANYEPDKQESMSRVAVMHSDIARELGLRCTTIRPLERVGKLRNLLPKLKKLFGYIDKYIIFPFELILYSHKRRAKKNIIYHITDHSNAMYSFCLQKRPRVITCHDVMAINTMLGKIQENKIGFTGKMLQKIILMGLKATPRIICVSKNTKRELQELVNSEGQKISIAVQPLNYEYENITREESLAIVKDIEEANNIELKGSLFYILVGISGTKIELVYVKYIQD